MKSEDPAEAVSACSLCAYLAPVLAESTYWRLALNRNQSLLGKTMLVLRRHLEPVTELTAAEWQELHTQIGIATEMLMRAFRPDHFNYAFLQNQDRHVHLHIIPRYAESRTFDGIVFTDPDYPGHYKVPGPTRFLDMEQLTRMVDYLQRYRPGQELAHLNMPALKAPGSNR